MSDFTRTFITNQASAVFNSSEKRAWEVTKIKILSDANTPKNIKVEVLQDGVTVSKTYNSGTFVNAYSFDQLDEDNFAKESIVRITATQTPMPATGALDQVKIYVTVGFMEDILEHILDEASGGLKATISAGSTGIPASAVTYDNSTSTLDSTNVQDAIDEIDDEFVHRTGNINETIDGEKTFAEDTVFSTDVLISGNLKVTGAIEKELEIEDNKIMVNKGETGAGVTAGTAGLEVDRGTLTNAEFLWDEAANGGAGGWTAGITGSMQELAYVGHGVAKLLHVATNGDDVIGDGTEGAPFLTIAEAINNAASGDVILLAPGVYTGADLPDGVSLMGAGLHRTTVTGDFATGVSALDLANFIHDGIITVNGTTDAMNLFSANGGIIANDDINAFNWTVDLGYSGIGIPMTVNSGLVSFISSTMQTGDQPSVSQAGGNVSFSGSQLVNASAMNTVVSTGGTFSLEGGRLLNLAAGPLADLNNGATSALPNALIDVFINGNIITGTAATLVSNVQGTGSITGTNLMFPPASQVANDSSVVGATVKEALDSLLTTGSNYNKIFSTTGATVSVSGNGTIATVTQANHGYISNQTVTVAGTANFDGTYVISYVDANTYSFSHPFVGVPEAGTVTVLDPWGGSDPATHQEAIDRILVALASHLGLSV